MTWRRPSSEPGERAGHVGGPSGGVGPLVASAAVIGDGTSGRPPERGRFLRVLTACIGLVVAAVVMASMGVQAVRGNRTVNVQRDRLTVHDAALDNAYYHCIEVQARSLVSPDHPVGLKGNLGDLITLIKGVGSWISVADALSTHPDTIFLTNNVPGPGTCRGTVVQIKYSHPHDGVTVRTGTGASVPGTGPPPAPPL